MRKLRVIVPCVVGAAILHGAPARAASATFDAGALIIPMDIDFQDAGMLKAFGLLDKLLRAGVPVQWVIKTPKVVVDTAKGKFEDDFTASAKDFKSGVTIPPHGYRGGPFVIRAADAEAAKTIITAWQATNTTTVHVTTAPFVGFVSRTLVAAPRIAVFADGSQNIAFDYLNAAGIRDKSGAAWTAASPDVLTPAQVMGPTSTNHADGALFRPSGQPAFCEIMTMHWKVNEPEAAEVSAELASFLKFPTHVNAECQAVNAIEGAPPTGGRSNFVSSKGFAWPAPSQPSTVEFLNSALPFAQMDGPFKTVGGSEPAYALGAGSTYYDTGIVMVKGAGKAVGVQDVWMTGYANTGSGVCPITDPQCIIGGKSLGKVSYLGGHSYDTKVPISTNPSTQGARLFLNSLYEAGCVTEEGRGDILLRKNAPSETAADTITYSIDATNVGKGPAIDVKVTDTLPAGTTFVSATKGGILAAGTVTWTLGDIASGITSSVEVTIKLPAFGAYANFAKGEYTVGATSVTTKSNTVTTTWVDCAGDGAVSCACSDSGPCLDAGADGGAGSDGALSDGAAGDGSSETDSAASGDTAIGDGSTEDTGASSDDATVFDGAPADTGGAADPPAAGVDSSGGCGCGVVANANDPWLLGGAALALALLRRRRR